MASPYDGRRRRRTLEDVSGPEVEVHLFAAARAAVGAPMVMAAPGSLQDILDGIESAHPSFAQVRPRCSCLVDGVAAHDGGVIVGQGHRIDVLPPFAGG